MTHLMPQVTAYASAVRSLDRSCSGNKPSVPVQCAVKVEGVSIRGIPLVYSEPTRYMSTDGVEAAHQPREPALRHRDKFHRSRIDPLVEVLP